MATSMIDAKNLFNVKGLVAVITGGGSGSFICFIVRCMLVNYVL